MKRFFQSAALVTGLAIAGTSGYVASESEEWPRITPERETPKAVTIKLRGPQEGLFGRDYFFYAETNGVRPQWQVFPAVDLQVSEAGKVARIRTEEVGEYVVTIMVAGNGGDIASDGLVFTTLDPTPEVVQLEGPTLSEQLHHRPLPGLWKTGIKELLRVAKELRAGLHPPEFEPIEELQSVLGEEWRPFLDDLSVVSNRLGHTSAVSVAPLLEEAALVLGGEL